MIGAIIKVNREVREAVLEDYLRRSLCLHTVAFMQWRLKNPSKLQFNPDELHEGIHARIMLVYGDKKDDNP